MKKRYNFMNVLRVLSMVAIVFYHMIFTLYIYGIRQLSSISFFFSNANMHIAKIGVGLFFMLSGAGLMLSSSNSFDSKTFYKKRFIKILIPFYIVYICYLFFLLASRQISISNPFGDRNVNPLSFIFTILGMDAYVDSFGIPTCSLGIGEWFLGCLIIIYLLYPFLRTAMIKNRILTMGIATIYYVLILICYSYIPYVNKVPMYTNLLVKIYDFILGMFLVHYIDRIPKLSVFISLVTCAAFLFIPVTLPGINSFQIPAQCVAVFIIFAALDKYFAKAPKPMKIIEKISSISYEYFLIHHCVILELSRQGQNTSYSNMNIAVLFLEEIIVTILLALVLKKVCELITKKH